MQKKGSKITGWMLITVFCLFALTACGNTADNAIDNTTETENPATRQETQDNAGETEAESISLTVSSPKTDDTVEGGIINVTGTVDNAPNPGKDKVMMELSADGKIIGKGESLVSDLDNAFSAELKYELTDTLTRADDNTVKAVLRLYLNDKENLPAAEKTVDLSLK